VTGPGLADRLIQPVSAGPAASPDPPGRRPGPPPRGGHAPSLGAV